MKHWLFFFIFPLLLSSEEISLSLDETKDQAVLPQDADNNFPKCGWVDPNICNNISFKQNPWLIYVNTSAKRKSQKIIEASVGPILNQLELVNSNEIASVTGPEPVGVFNQVIRHVEDDDSETVADNEEGAAVIRPELVGALEEVVRHVEEDALEVVLNENDESAVVIKPEPLVIRKKGKHRAKEDDSEKAIAKIKSASVKASAPVAARKQVKHHAKEDAAEPVTADNEIASIMGPAPIGALKQVFRGSEEKASKKVKGIKKKAEVKGPAPVADAVQILQEVEEDVEEGVASNLEKVTANLEKITANLETVTANLGKDTSKKGKKGGIHFLPKRVELNHIEGWGAGANYGTNYTTLAMLWGPNYKVGHFLPMVDLRAHRFDNSSWAGSVGFVGRYIPKDFCELLGVNVYYDYRQGSYGQFQQVGLGFEILGKRWDFRANGYVPVSVTRHCNKCVFDEYDAGYYIIDRRIETVSYGYNAEVGYLFVRSNKFLLYGAAGPYYMTGRRCHEKTAGGKVRIRPQYKDYIAVDLSATYDPVFKAVYQAEVIISLPLYQIKSQNKGLCGVTDRQIYQRVERFEVMPIGKCRCVKTNF